MSDQTNAKSPRELIEYIRREEFGVDIDASEQEQRRAKNLRSKLDRALALLATDLYSKQTHFILELIQNADDNSYPDTVVPRLSFTLLPEQMTLVNNELGFSPKHVIALCDVGKSSKEKKSGYIGEKGIGFKSVFTVSDAPEIHSNGFHFRFNRAGKDNLLGFVVPEWCEPPKYITSDATTIILPAKKANPFSEIIFADLKAELLLFLSRLRRLELTYDGSTTVLERQERGGFTCLLKQVDQPNIGTEAEETRFLRISTVVPMHAAEDEKRPDVETSDIVLAFPVSSVGLADPQENSQVFAFLPINSFGFKFAVQADFILSSSREAIHTERKWNRHLRDFIAKCFVDAVSEFGKHEALAFSYLKFIPNESDVVDPFFKPVCGQIISLLAGTNCLPSASGDWKVPRALKYGSSSFQRLFPPAVAQELFGFDYVDSRVSTDLAILDRLGAKPIYILDFVNVFKNHGEWFNKQSPEWKANFYACLADLDRASLFKAGLLSTPCVPTSTGTLVSPDKTVCFYPLTRGKKYGFEEELTIVDIDLLERAATQSTHVDSLIADLNVRRDDPYNLIMSHILPRHEGEAWKAAENEAIIGHVRYIKQKLEKYIERTVEAGGSENSAIATISKGIWLGTKENSEDNWIFARADTLYLSKEYEPQFCIESLLGTVLSKTSLVSEEYLSNKARESADEASSWRQFFTRIGVREAPKIEKLQDGDVQPSAELHALLTAEQSSVRKATLECLDRNWQVYSSELGFWPRSGRNVSKKETKLALALRTMNAPTKRRTPTLISDTYYPNEDLKDLFGDAPVYLDAKLARTELLEACHVTFRIDASACIKRLKQLKMRGGETTPLVSAIYRHLERLWDREAEYITDAFAQEGLIRVKGPHATWAGPDEVVWRSGGAFLDSLYPPLRGQYHDFSGFFKRLGVRWDLPTDKLVKAIPRLMEIESIDDRAREALAIYKRASHDLMSQSRGMEDVQPDWLDTFHHEDVFLNQRGELVSNNGSLFANDAPELGALFADDPNISLLAAPLEDLPRVHSLLEASEVPSLAHSVEVVIVEAKDGHLRSDLTEKIRSVAIFIARALYARSHLKFSSALSQGLFQRLRELEIVEVSDLQLEVTVNGVSRRASRDIASFENRIAVKRGARSVIDQLAIELCKLLKAPDELADTISRFLLADDSETVEDFLRVRRISGLPSDIEKVFLSGEEQRSPELDFDGIPDGELQAPKAPEGEDVGGEESASRHEPAAPRQIDRRDPMDVGPGPFARAPGSLDPISPKQSEPDPAGPSKGHNEISNVNATEHSARPTPREIAGGVFDGGTSPHPEAGPVLGGNKKGGGSAAQLESEQSTRFRSDSNNLESGLNGRGSRKHNNRQHRTKSGRLMSYAASPAEAERASREEDPARTAARNATAQAAVEYVLVTQRARWKSLVTMPSNNPGFDIKAISHEGHDEFIEVKGQGAAWTEDGVALTPTELAAAQRHGEHYWLCVVEFATDEKRRNLYLIKNPFGLTQQFRFDSGWKSAAYSQSTAPLRPEAGLAIDLPELGTGKILSVRKKGQFYNLHVILADGRQVNRVFNPATMNLSAE